MIRIPNRPGRTETGAPTAQQEGPAPLPHARPTHSAWCRPPAGVPQRRLGQPVCTRAIPDTLGEVMSRTIWVIPVQGRVVDVPLAAPAPDSEPALRADRRSACSSASDPRSAEDPLLEPPTLPYPPPAVSTRRSTPSGST